MKNSAKTWCVFFFIVLALIGAPPADAAEQGHLVIATTDNGPLSLDRLLYLAFRNIQYDIDFITPIVREGYVQADDGTCDGTKATYPNLDSLYVNLRAVPVPLERTYVRVFARAGSDLQIDSWDELDGLRVGILENRAYMLERLPATVAISERETTRAVLNGLVDGEYDVAVLSERAHETLGERLDVIRIGVVDELTEYLYLNKAHEDLIPKITAALESIMADGSAERILNDLPVENLNPKKTILHITSFQADVGREDQLTMGLREPFEDDMSIEWMTLNLDSKRFIRGQYNMAHIASLLRADCIPRNISAIIVSGNMALDFLMDYYYLYFRNTPVLFYGVSERYKEIINDNEQFFTGVVKNLEAYATVDAALSLFPDTKNLYVVNDYSTEGLKYRALIEAELEPLGARLNIEYNENLTAEDLMERIGELPQDSLVLVGSYFVDANYQYYSTVEMKRLLERSCSVPILSLYSTDPAYNALGGKPPDYRQYGGAIAEMLEMLLDGSRAEDIPVVFDSTPYNRWVFDRIQLDRFNIKPRDLPAGAEILNRSLPIWESNPQFFITILILLIVSVFFVIGTFIFIIFNHRHNRQKNRLQQELAIEKSMLEAIFNSVPELLFVKDLNHVFIRVNKKFMEHCGLAGEEATGRRDSELNLPGDLIENMRALDRAVIDENRLVMIESAIPNAHGESPYFEIIETPLSNNGKTVGVVGIAYDVTRRKEMEEAAKSASRAKSNFLANMSHEMRTPLTTVLGLTELTLETVQLDDETHSNFVKIYRAGETILGLVNDILDISKIEADKLVLNEHEYDVPSLVNDTITQCSLYVGDKPIEFVLNIDGDLLNYLYGDGLRIRQILNNLLSNAFKFTKEGTVELGVRTEREGDIVRLTAWVRDTGIGIRAEDMDKLFALYVKLEEESEYGGANRRTEGTGLGLSISKRLADLMNGSITVESEYGKGSIFTVRLAQKHVSDALVGKDVAENLKSFNYSIKKFEDAKMTRLNMSYAKILVVDDNPTNLDVARGLMGLYGMKVDGVTGGQQAIDAVRDEKSVYNAIFMDHMMPEMDGIEAARIIREEIGTEYARNVPIIALTANAIIGNEEMFLQKGFQDFISKPIDLARLDAVVRRWVRDKAAEELLPERTIVIKESRGESDQVLRGGIPGLDIKKGILHFGKNADEYLKVLKSYAINNKALLDTIAEIDADGLSEYAVIVHGIKGSSYGIFAEEAVREASALEEAAIAGNYEYVTANHQRFLDIVYRLIADIEEAVGKRKENKPIKDKPDEALLAKLLSAFESYDIDEMDAAMTEIEKWDYSSDDGLAAWLRASLSQGDYKSIDEKLRALFRKGEE